MMNLSHETFMFNNAVPTWGVLLCCRSQVRAPLTLHANKCTIYHWSGVWFVIVYLQTCIPCCCSARAHICDCAHFRYCIVFYVCSLCCGRLHRQSWGLLQLQQTNKTSVGHMKGTTQHAPQTCPRSYTHMHWLIRFSTDSQQWSCLDEDETYRTDTMPGIHAAPECIQTFIQLSTESRNE